MTAQAERTASLEATNARLCAEVRRLTTRLRNVTADRDQLRRMREAGDVVRVAVVGRTGA